MTNIYSLDDRRALEAFAQDSHQPQPRPEYQPTGIDALQPNSNPGIAGMTSATATCSRTSTRIVPDMYLSAKNGSCTTARCGRAIVRV